MFDFARGKARTTVHFVAEANAVWDGDGVDRFDHRHSALDVVRGDKPTLSCASVTIFQDGARDNSAEACSSPATCAEVLAAVKVGNICKHLSTGDPPVGADESCLDVLELSVVAVSHTDAAESFGATCGECFVLDVCVFLEAVTIIGDDDVDFPKECHEIGFGKVLAAWTCGRFFDDKFFGSACAASDQKRRKQACHQRSVYAFHKIRLLIGLWR